MRPRPRTLETRVGNSSLEALQLADEVRADAGGVLDQVLLVDDLEVALRADHVGEVAAPRRVDARGDA